MTQSLNLLLLPCLNQPACPVFPIHAQGCCDCLIHSSGSTLSCIISQQPSFSEGHLLGANALIRMQFRRMTAQTFTAKLRHACQNFSLTTDSYKQPAPCNKGPCQADEAASAESKATSLSFIFGQQQTCKNLPHRSFTEAVCNPKELPTVHLPCHDR